MEILLLRHLLWSAGLHEFLGNHFRFSLEGGKVVSVALNVSVKTQVTGLVRMPSERSGWKRDIFRQVKIAFRNLQAVELFQIEFLEQRTRRFRRNFAVDLFRFL